VTYKQTFLKCNVSYIYATVEKILTDRASRGFSAIAEFLVDVGVRVSQNATDVTACIQLSSSRAVKNGFLLARIYNCCSRPLRCACGCHER